MSENTPEPVTAPAVTSQSAAKSGIRGHVVAAAVGAAVTALLTVILISLGLGSGYSVTIVDQEQRAATVRSEIDEDFTIVDTKKRICGDGEDYAGCTKAHIAHHKTICTKQSLTRAAEITCDELKDFLKALQAELEKCVPGCTTKAIDGEWGSTYRQLQPVLIDVPNSDDREQITHVEHCVFSLAGITLGECNCKK